MRTFLVVAISISGWVLTGTYFLYEYQKYGMQVFRHMFAFESVPSLVFHFFMLTAPGFSAALGYLIHERFKLSDSIANLKDRYEDYYDKAPHGYLSTGPDGVILEVNETWLRMLGLTEAEVVGRLRLSALVMEEQREAYERAERSFLESGRMDDFETVLIRGEGGRIPVLLNSTAVFGPGGKFLRSRTIVQDIAQLKEYEKALVGAAEEWKTTFDCMPWGVMLLDKDFNVLRANEYMASMAGASIADLLNRKCYVSVHGSERPAQGCAFLKALNSGQTEVYEYCDRGKDKHFRVYCRPVESGDTPARFIHSIVDITDIKKGERRLLDSRSAYFNMLKDGTEAYKNLNELHNSLILAFANAIDAKSPWTKGHSERVCRYAVAIAKEMGLPERDVTLLNSASLLHDIGKIGTFDYLLDKPESLTPEEYEIVKRHPENSARILEPIERFKSVIEVVRYHHERYDGKGYPTGIAGVEIPLLARILCVADSFDSMTADRPYRPAPGMDYAIGEMLECSGTHFDPVVVEAFVRHLRGGRTIQREEYGNTGVHR